MNVNQKGNLIFEFYKRFREDPKFRTYFTMRKYGVALSVYAVAGMERQDDLVDPQEFDDVNSDEVDRLINNAWVGLCHELGDINPDLEFESLSELLDYRMPVLASVDEILERIETSDKSETYTLGKYSAWTIDALENIVPIAFADDQNAHLRIFIYGALSGLRDKKCFCSKEHSERSEPFGEMLNQISIDELPETGYRNILAYLMVRATKTGKLDKLMDDQAFKRGSALDFDDPSCAFTKEGKLDPGKYEPHRKFIESLGKNFDEFMDATSQNFLEAGNFVFTNLRYVESDTLVDSFEGLDQAIEEYEFLRDDVKGVDEEDFVNYVFEDENWYPRALYTAVANRSSRFPGKIPEGTETRWNYELSGEPPGFFPLDLQEILSLIPRFRVFSQNELLGEILQECHYVFIDPMPGLVMTRSEIQDSLRIQQLTDLRERMTSGHLEGYAYDDSIESESILTTWFTDIAATLYVNDQESLKKLAGVGSGLLSHAMILNPALSLEARESLMEELDLEYIHDELEEFISSAEESRDYEFAELLKTFRD